MLNIEVSIHKFVLRINIVNRLNKVPRDIGMLRWNSNCHIKLNFSALRKNKKGLSWASWAEQAETVSDTS